MTIGSNIRRLRTLHDLTQEEFGKLAGVSAMAVSQWENERAVPRMGAVQKISDALGVSKNDIIGESPLSIPGSFYPAPSHYATAPLFGRIHAGDAQEPDILEKEIELPLSVSKSHPNAYFLEVEGDCMDKVYPEGCLILVDPDREPQNGSIAAVSIDGSDYVMRRLLRTANTMILAPESFNTEHEDIVITASSGKTVSLAGTVVWFQPAKEME